MNTMIDDDLRATFAAVADVLIQAWKDMPAASGGEVAGAKLDRIPSLRDGLKEPFLRALKAMKGNIDAVFHLAAVYDLSADEEAQVRANIDGTRATVEFAKAIGAKHFHHVSSIAAAGFAAALASSRPSATPRHTSVFLPASTRSIVSAPWR